MGLVLLLFSSKISPFIASRAELSFSFGLSKVTYALSLPEIEWSSGLLILEGLIKDQSFGIQGGLVLKGRTLGLSGNLSLQIEGG